MRGRKSVKITGDSSTDFSFVFKTRGKDCTNVQSFFSALVCPYL